MSFEKVVSWIWKKEEGDKGRKDSYYYDTIKETIIIVRGDDKPENSKELIDPDRLMKIYVAKGRKNLREPAQMMYDYLSTRRKQKIS